MNHGKTVVKNGTHQEKLLNRWRMDKLQDALFQAAEQQKQITLLQVVFTNHEQSHTKLIAGAKRRESSSCFKI
jgi:hypothetical protein